MRISQTSFNAGELSPQVAGRSDLAKYVNGVVKCQNMIPLVHGPLAKRGGWENLVRVKDHSKKTLLFGFAYSAAQSYVIEVGDQYYRLHTPDGQVLEKAEESIEGISNTSPAVVTITGHSFVNGDVVYIKNVIGMPEVNGIEAVVANAGANDFELAGIDAILYGTYSSGGTASVPYEIASPYLEAYLDDLDFETSGATIFIAHGLVAPSTLVLGASPTYLTSSGISFTGAPASWVAGNYPQEVELDNERLWFAKTSTHPLRLWGSKVGIYYTHTAGTDPDDPIDITLGGRQANEIEWLVSGTKFACGTTGAEFWLTGANGTGAIQFDSRKASLGSREGCGTTKPIMAGNTLLFLQRHNKVLRELRYAFESDSFAGEIMTALVEHLTRDYTITQMAFQNGPYRTIWCRRSDGTLLGMTYYPEHDVFGWHVHPATGTGADIEKICVVPGPVSDLLYGIVKRTINGVTVRHIERMDGDFSGDDTDDAHFLDSYLVMDNRQAVESISYADPGVISLTGHGYSDNDLVTFRRSDREFDIDGLTSLHYEDYYVVNSAANTFQVESSIGGGAADLTAFDPNDDTVTTTVAKKVSAITGLDHLEGEVVGCLADGGATQNYTVSDGAISLVAAASLVCVGLKYNADVELFTPGMASEQRGVAAALKRITGVIFQFHKSLGLKFGRSFSNLYDIPFTDDTVPLGRPPSLQDGLSDLYEVECGYERDAHLCIRSDQPYPLTLLAVYQEVEFEDD